MDLGVPEDRIEKHCHNIQDDPLKYSTELGAGKQCGRHGLIQPGPDVGRCSLLPDIVSLKQASWLWSPQAPSVISKPRIFTGDTYRKSLLQDSTCTAGYTKRCR